jgi:CelD/BcsL family acetyltransferase involved in cellulose biosynthesis
MRIDVIDARELSTKLVASWIALQSTNATIDSPFFRPEYAQAIGDMLGRVEVAVLEDCGSVVGFFPFYRSRTNVGWPLPLSEFQGLILQPGVAVQARELIHSCGLSAWHFDQALASQAVFQPHHWVRDASPCIDTSNGFAAYWAQRSRNGSETVTKTLQKMRKLEREVGPVRFEPGTKDERVLQSLFTWKARQYQRTRHFDIFSREWTKQLLRRLLDKTDLAFGGVLSGLYVNDELQAVLYSLRSQHVLHTWASAFRPDLAKYSPGYQLLLKVIQSANAQGIERIDLSKGHHERYKQSFMTGAIPLAAGSVDARTTRVFRYAWQRAHFRVRESPIRDLVAIPWRWIQRAVRQMQFP